MEELKEHFITSIKEYKEGEVGLFKQNINVKKLKKATLYITALGIYEAQINGKQVGEQMFAPGFTYYHRDLQYQEYDVKNLLVSGENELKVYLGQGWYCGRFTFDNITQIYGEKSAVSWIIVLENENGEVESYASDNDNVEELESPYEYAGFYDGEIYYGSGSKKESEEIIGSPVKYTSKIPEVIEKDIIVTKIKEEMVVKNVIKNGDVTILDFGQNFAGIVEIDPLKMKGDKIKIRHGEILNPDGSLYTINLRKAKAEIIYHKGTEKDKYRPKFTYMGFRYMEISDTEYVDGMITAYAIYSEMKRTGHFSTSNKLVQQLYENQIWGQKSNYIEVPTDCPQRDERMGYTGDGHVFALTGSYNFDTEDFWNKFLKDMRYSQMDNTEGYIGSTIPANGPGGIGFLSMLGWGNAVTILPEMLYWQYGEEKYLIKQYESMKLFVEAEIRKMGDANLWLGPNLGDWLMLGKDVAWMAMHNNPVSNSFIVNDLRILSKTARRLGKIEDVERYESQLNKTRDAYIKAFINEDGKMTDDYQGAYIMALKHVIQDAELRKKVLANLIENINLNGMQTGFFSTEHILPILAEAGEIKLAYDLLLQEGCPGWMYQIKCGATTTWERWNAIMPDGKVNEEKMSSDNMVSFNHYSFGSVGEFYYQYILGIKPLLPGYKKIKIAPKVDKRLGKVSGSYESRVGNIEVNWSFISDENNSNTVKLMIKTPVDSIIELPDGNIHEVVAGEYKYQCTIQKK
ncbi:alpha-L-rhamnosidase [Clostridium sp.]|uniref:alpha-L-rhamnosidase n=1 Tax=Clostridium sp. TaxID=1506 RepID=UPI001DC4E16E|nr:alpha-L-rhamnosidase [Clostridium sp.]MBS5937952.1 family 78 glycoside hydrolase catalytic domain [Clostridium sp.]